ncbi:Uncharacterized protein APZ42_027978, partial [Daphnia magna]
NYLYGEVYQEILKCFCRLWKCASVEKAGQDLKHSLAKQFFSRYYTTS